MAELFIELFSEEIPAKLQLDARNKIKHMLYNYILVSFRLSVSVAYFVAVMLTLPSDPYFDFSCGKLKTYF